MPKTYNDIYLELRKSLKAEGIEGYNLEAKLLCASAAGKSSAEFFRDLRLYAAQSVENKAAEYLERRKKGEPVAYITGSWEFYGLELDINENVLIPRVDTEVLAETAINILKPRLEATRVLDLCTGSGCVGLAVAANVPGCRVVMADKSAGAIAVARGNSIKNNLSSRATCIEADVFERPPMLLGTFDLLLCNPPYIPKKDIPNLDVSVKDYEPITALDGGADGLNFYKRILSEWKAVMKHGGIMAFECGIDQAEQVKAIMEEQLFRNIATVKDSLGIDRVIYGNI